jgi:hypothetical protein
MAAKYDPRTTCVNLRTKKMYYDAAGIGAPPDPGIEKAYGTCSTAHCWCLKTQVTRGPDDRIVGIEECSRPDRECHEGIESLG